MSKTTTAKAGETTAEEQPSALAQLGRLVEFDPRGLELDPRNARTENPKPDAALLASVERIGVQDPISVRPLGEGRYGVYKGQRRWLASLAAAKKAEAKGQPIRPIPAFVRDDLAGVDGEALLLSLVENTQRRRMTDRDQINGAAQLELIGTSEAGRRRAAAILGMTRPQLKAAKQAAELSPERLKEGTGYAFDLMELADLQSVEDMPRAAYRLHVAKRKDAEDPKSRRGAWQHTMAQLRQEQAAERKREAATQALTEAGVKVLPQYRAMDATDRRLPDLTTRAGKKITARAHATCEGHAARLDDDGEPVFYCTDPARYGHKITGVPDAAEAEAAAKKQRAKVIKNNKAARAAREVRKEFITDQLCRKPLSDAAWTLVLDAILHNADPIRRFPNKTDANRNRDIARFTRAADPEGKAEPFADLIKKTGKARRPNLLLAYVAAAHEAEMNDAAWEQPSGTAHAWLTFLAAEGYPLSEHEAAIVAKAEGQPVDEFDDEEQTQPIADEPTVDEEQQEQSTEEQPEREAEETATAPQEAAEADESADEESEVQPEAEEPAMEPQEAAQAPEQDPVGPQAEETATAPEESAQE
ncbi:ParB N-terminal domain-containing protein [Streptomyces sp. NPDC005408]|uniref:ParB/RepB/Spo0J family partition protein n=1 Tax=Streptomyces sp. NPDC005408 TaxID=3155341 RepID=UPI0033A7E199